MFDFLKNILGRNDANNQEFGSFDDNKRVSWEPSPPKPDDTVHINYQGLLKDSGAGEVYLHYGFDSWSKEISTVKMEMTVNGDFGSDITYTGNPEINFCFKDSANNWDNNDGHNWTLHIQ